MMMTLSQFDQFMEEMPERGIPECDIAVTLNGELVYSKAVGRDDPERNVSYVCSISKITTCVAALRLIEEGKLSLDDPVAKYLPAYGHLLVKEKDGSVRPARNGMTVRHLFTMTGGLNYSLNYAPILRACAIPGAGTVDVVNSFVQSPLDFEPGARFQYSLCHDVLAAVVEIACGRRFADYVQETIFDPLGMADSGYHLPEELNARMTRQYQYVNGIHRSREVMPANKYILTPDYDSGGAGLYTTTPDQLKLLTALALGGTARNGYRLLNEETVRACEVGQLSDEQILSFWPARLYGYNWGLCGRVHTRPVISGSLSPVGEFGWDGATGPYGLVDRQNGLAFYFGMHIYGCTYIYNQMHGTIRNNVYRTFLGK